MARATPSDIEQHPDLAAMRLQSERATATPTAQGIEALSLLAGLYLALSPWIVGFSNFPELLTVNLIAGLAYAVLAVGLGTPYERTHGMSWAAAGIGVWTIVAPWVVLGSAATIGIILSNVIIGAIMVVLALATAAMGMAKRS